MSHSNYNIVKSHIFGHTVDGLPIPSYHFGQGNGVKVLILGGVHGDEVEGVSCAYGLLKSFSQSFTYKLDLTLVPALNLDGVLKKTRQNSNNIDLNRNLPTQDWTSEVHNPRYFPGNEPNSEPENQALVNYLTEHSPRFVLSLHSWKPLLNKNGNCAKEAEAISALTGYIIEDSIGYPTPGCLGTYCGLEREMPTLTYEIERGLDAPTILAKHVPAILEALKQTEMRG